MNKKYLAIQSTTFPDKAFPKNYFRQWESYIRMVNRQIERLKRRDSVERIIELEKMDMLIEEANIMLHPLK